MYKFHPYCLMLIITMFYGCSTKIPLTRDMFQQYAITSADDIQYYVSNRIDLVHEEKVESVFHKSRDIKGTVKIVRDIAFVAPQTPGVAVEYADNLDYIWVSFERGSKFKFKWYPDKGVAGQYCLYPDRKLSFDERMARPGAPGVYVFRYRNKDYYAASIKDIYLLIDSAYLEEIEENKHRLKGIRVKPSNTQNRNSPGY